MGRLFSAANPESGFTCQSTHLQYDDGGATGAKNLLGRVSRATTGPCDSNSPYLYENFSYTSGGLLVTKAYSINYPASYGGGVYYSPGDGDKGPEIGDKGPDAIVLWEEKHLR